MSVLRACVGASIIATAAACGDVYADPEPTPAAGTPVGVPTAADAGIGGPFSGDAPTHCPPTRPRENSACSHLGSTCEYGTSADGDCNVSVACEGEPFASGWTPRQKASCFERACPVAADVGALDGKPCNLADDDATISDADEAVCNMADGVCACTTGRDGATRHERRWVCVRPLSLCPPNRPLLGEPCSGRMWCDYGSCSFKRGLVMECVDGAWLSGGDTCQ